MPFWEGLGSGLATAFLIGPVFFTLLKASLDHGARGGAFVATGIIVSDILVLVICRTGANSLLKLHIGEGFLAVMAGIILLGLGVWYIIKPHPGPEAERRLGRAGTLGLFSTGFLVNFVNPFVFMVWTGFTLHAATVHGHNNDGVVFLGAILLGIYITDLIKAWYAPKLKQWLSPGNMKALYRVIGIVMLVFSVRVFVHAATTWN